MLGAQQATPVVDLFGRGGLADGVLGQPAANHITASQRVASHTPRPEGAHCSLVTPCHRIPAHPIHVRGSSVVADVEAVEDRIAFQTHHQRAIVLLHAVIRMQIAQSQTCNKHVVQALLRACNVTRM